MEYKIPNYILATKNVRFVNFIIDLAVIYLINFFVLLISNYIPFNDEYPTISDWISSFDRAQYYIYLSIISFVYYSITEIFLSRSIAKYLTKTIVVLENGTKPKTIDIISRSALRQVPLEHFTFLRGRKLGLHDEYSKTFVVKKDKLEKSIADFK